MTEEVIEKVASMSDTAIAKALADVDATESFVVEQAPLLVQEILNWGFAENLIHGVLWGVFGAGLMYGTCKAVRFLDKSDNRDSDIAISFVVIFGGGGSVLSLIGSFCYFLTMVKIIVAPRLYLLETFSDLL